MPDNSQEDLGAILGILKNRFLNTSEFLTD